MAGGRPLTVFLPMMRAQTKLSGPLMLTLCVNGTPPAEKLSPLFYDFYGLGGRDPRVRTRLQAYFRAYRQVIAAVLAQGVARGEFRPLDVERLAILFAALYEGMLEMAMLDPDNVQAVYELVDALDVLFLGLRP